MFQKATAKIRHTLLRYFSVCFVRFHFCIKGKKWRRLKVESLKSKVESLKSKVEGLKSKVEGLRSKVDGLRSKGGCPICCTLFLVLSHAVSVMLNAVKHLRTYA